MIKFFRFIFLIIIFSLWLQSFVVAYPQGISIGIRENFVSFWSAGFLPLPHYSLEFPVNKDRFEIGFVSFSSDFLASFTYKIDQYSDSATRILLDMGIAIVNIQGESHSTITINPATLFFPLIIYEFERLITDKFAFQAYAGALIPLPVPLPLPLFGIGLKYYL